MNSLFFAAPSWVLWLYVVLALVGLSRSQNESSQLACLTALAYLLAFAFVGRPENFYWGLMPAPFLAWGIGRMGNAWFSDQPSATHESDLPLTQSAARSQSAEIAASI
jgi:hypothetical protein